MFSDNIPPNLEDQNPKALAQVINDHKNASTSRNIMRNGFKVQTVKDFPLRIDIHSNKTLPKNMSQP